MKKVLFIIAFAILYFNIVQAQNFGYDSKIVLSQGLYKVKSGNYYGIINSNDDVVVSIEYDDMLFRNGKALLVKNGYLHGTVDTLGNIKMIVGEYRVHPKYKYIYDGFIIVGNMKYEWGFISENGEPLHVDIKSKGLFLYGKKQPTMFNEVAPFIDGIAAAYLKKGGWIHIDISGKEHFKLDKKMDKALFRSSLYKGESIIITESGIKLYQENPAFQAVVKRVLSPSATIVEYSEEADITKLIFKEGVLTLDSLMRVTKYETKSDSIVFIQKPRKVIVKKVEVPVDTLSVKEDMDVLVVKNVLQANEKGRAYSEIRLVNKSDEKFEDLSVLVECAGAAKDWNGVLEGKSSISIPFTVPAKFSSASLKRNIIIEVNYKDEFVKFEIPVTINRYNPVRSR